MLQWILIAVPLVINSLAGYWIHTRPKRDATVVRLRHWERLSGIVILSVGIALLAIAEIINLSSVADVLRWNMEVGLWSLALIVVSAAAGSYIHVHAKPGSTAWQLRQFDRVDFGKNLLVWIVYLLLYEFYFRGLLMQSEDIPVKWLMVLNVGYYALVHIPHGKAETIAAIPYGILLAVSVWQCGSMWPAFLGHMSLVITTQFIRLTPKKI